MTTSNESKKRAPTLRSTIWLYFSAFTAVILILIWLFQIATLGKYYELSKRREIISASMKISSSFDSKLPKEFRSLVESIACENGMTIAITDWAGNKILVSNYMMSSSILSSENSYRLFEYRNQITSDPNSQIFLQTQNEHGTNEILYGTVLSKPKIGNSGYILLIHASLEPIGSTVEIMKEQFVFITLITFFIALFITMLLSSRLSSPFTNITALAHKMAAGDYSVRFAKGSYAEINELSDSLNYAASEISKVDTLKNELIANVSHDLRTPLTMIKAYAEMIRDLSGDNPVKREEHLKVIIDETDRLSVLVSSLLELSKLQSGSTNIVQAEFSSSEFLNGILEKYHLFSERQGYEFVLEEDEDVKLYGDRAKLEQVMYNFINNAVNYSGDSKKIIIRQINKPDTARIEVRDFGVGIEKDKLPLIFDRYYRDERTKRDVVGSGLGLSIVKQILESHKFRFGVLSEVGSGSTFWFEIKRSGVQSNESKSSNSKSNT